MPETPQDIVRVSTQEALTQAYLTLSNSAEGGRIVIAADADPLEISLKNGGAAHVTITSEDGNAPSHVTRIELRDVENVTVDGLYVSSNGVTRPQHHSDVDINGSDRVTLSNLVFESDASGYYDPSDPDAVLGERLGFIGGSTNVTFVNNDVSDYYHGLSIKHSQGVLLEGNTFAEMQGDGVRMSSVRDVDVLNNTFRDFHGTVQTFNHNDMLQIWSTSAKNPSTNITIDGNLFDAGHGQASQSIFIRNEKFDGKAEDALPHSDITITNNVIYNGHVHGIAVSSVEGLTVSQNTLLWNPDAMVITATGDDPTSKAPGIRVRGMDGAVVADNIAGFYTLTGDVVESNNHEVNYDNPLSERYVGETFLNLPDGARGDVADVFLDPDGAFAGAGAAQTAPVLESEAGVVLQIRATPDLRNPQRVTFDATGSVDEDGAIAPNAATFQWHFADGTLLTGQQVTHTFAGGGPEEVTLIVSRGGDEVARSTHFLEVAGMHFLMLDFENGLADVSGYDTHIVSRGATLVDAVEGNTFLHIGGENTIGTTRAADQYHSLKHFSLAVDLAVNGESQGKFLEFGHVMRAWIEQDGAVHFRLGTNEGRFFVESGDVSIHDGEMHRIAVSYCDSAGELVLAIDGQIVGVTAASGNTPPQGAHGITIGATWGNSVDAHIAQVYLGADPAQISLPFLGLEEVQAEPEDEYLVLDFSQGLEDTSIHATDLVFAGADLVQTDDGTEAIRIGDEDIFRTTRDAVQYHELDSFGFSIDMAVIDESEGRFLQFGHVMWAWVEEDGTVFFRLGTNIGRATVNSGDVSIHDGLTHTISVGYSDAAGQLVMAIDGAVVGTTEAYGITPSQGPHGIIIGSSWSRALDAYVESVYLGADPAQVGIDLATEAVGEDRSLLVTPVPDLPVMPDYEAFMADYAVSHPQVLDAVAVSAPEVFPEAIDPDLSHVALLDEPTGYLPDLTGALAGDGLLP